MNTKMIAATIALVMALAMGMPASAQSADAPPAHLGDNAALVYWQAISFMQRWPEDDWKIVDAFDAPQIDRAAATTLLRGATVHLLHEAAEQPWCDWGLRLERDGPYTLLPYLTYFNRMSKILLLEGRLKIQDCDGPAAAHDWICALSVARHAGCNGGSIPLLVDYGIEKMTINNAALDLNRLDKPALEQLAAELRNLPAGGTVAQCVQIEQEVNQRWMIRKFRENHDQGAQAATAPAALTGGSADPLGIAALIAASGGTYEGLARKLENLDPLYARIAQTVTLPYAQFQTKWPEIQRDLDADPVARFAVSGGFPRLVRIAAVVDAHLAMFAAAADVLHSGVDALKNHPDPFGTGPFTYRQTPQGFELSSKLTNEDASPVTLKIGRTSPK